MGLFEAGRGTKRRPIWGDAWCSGVGITQE
jgi:hypothetical protein